jgi:hypothetical protein
MTQRDLEKKFLSRKLSTATAEDLKNEAFRYWLLYPSSKSSRRS